jgi:hypothetical protein
MAENNRVFRPVPRNKPAMQTFLVGRLKIDLFIGQADYLWSSGDLLHRKTYTLSFDILYRDKEEYNTNNPPQKEFHLSHLKLP